MSKRILDETTTSSVASDDYLYMDGSTNGSRKITPDNLVANTTTASNLTSHISDANDAISDIQSDIATNVEAISTTASAIGTLSDLSTTAQTDLVSAINETYALAGSGSSSSGTGLTDEAITALLNCFANVAWIGTDGQDYYDALETALTSTDRTVTYSLTNCSSSNTDTTVTYGSRYTATLTASTDYTLNTVSVTMGGSDITSSVYTSGTISIPSVTGNIVITATAVLAAESITATYTQSGTVYDTADLSDLTSDLVVVANYSDSTTATLTSDEYTLSGTLTEGTSTITVAYGGKTATFNVTVTHFVTYYPKTLTYTDDGVGFGSVDSTKATNTTPYVSNTGKSRIHCIGDNTGYLVEVGKTYQITISNPSTQYVGVQTFNTIAQANLENTENVDSANKSDTGWLDISSGSVTFTPAYINGYAPACIWLNFKPQSSGTATWSVDTIEQVEIFPITISEVSQ